MQENAQITGTTIDRSGLAYANVSLSLVSVDTTASGTPKLSTQTRSDDQGNFHFTALPFGEYLLTVRYVGYKTQQLPVFLSQDKPIENLQITLIEEYQIIEDIIVFGKSETRQARELAVRAVVVDVSKVAEQPTTLAELMNRSTGIRMRQSGGLGNTVDISINGFQGNSVQYFKDGIPLDYLGGGYGLNNVPINLLERVEIFKGVVPVALGGDALGGAVNLVTKTHQKAYLSASYEVASFNTHIGQLAAYQQFSGNYFAGLDAFYNYSDNDYQTDVQVVDENANPVEVTVPLFHNGYRQHFVEVFGGIKNTTWANELRFSLVHYGIDRESQHPALMTNPYGALMAHNKGLIPSLRYKKSWVDQRLSLDQFVSYSHIQRSRIDTVMGSYDWYGNFRPGTSMGESPRRSFAEIDFENIMSRSHLIYRIDNNHKLEANIVINLNNRIGSDPYGLRFSGTDIDVLSKKATYHKTISGLTWESNWLNNRLINQSTVKYFYFLASGINGFMANATDLDQFTESSNHNFGLGNALKFAINRRSFVRASIELTNRLPREAELFGDSDTRAPNFQLEPERSFNVNLGYSYDTDRLHFEAGTFYRKTQGMILLVPVQPPFAQYQNLDSIRGYGFDLDLSYQFAKNWTFQGNLTWQDNRMVDIGDGLHKWIEGTRLRNTPYFFSNASISGQFANLFSTGDGFKPYLHWNYIREFYLNHIPRDKEPQGFLGLFGKSGVPVTNLIPDQHLLNVGFNYYFVQQPITLGFEVKNLTDTKLYDYYKIQRPGRSIHFKINYLFNK